jgi:hypothetical protein
VHPGHIAPGPDGNEQQITHQNRSIIFSFSLILLFIHATLLPVNSHFRPTGEATSLLIPNANTRLHCKIKVKVKVKLFYVRGSVHHLRYIYINNCPTRCNNTHFLYICKLLYMFRVVTPLIIRSWYHCICSIWLYWDRTANCLECDWMGMSRMVAVRFQ